VTNDDPRILDLYLDASPTTRTLAYATVEWRGWRVAACRLMRGDEPGATWLAWPSRRTPDGWLDLAVVTDRHDRERLLDAVRAAYEQATATREVAR
jgi:DNA-binding cell septation regulator SpoVG